MASSQVRHNYHQDCEASINRMVNLKLHASYTYTSMAMHFDHDTVALAGFSSFFKGNSHEKREQAEKLWDYQNKRGGHIALQDITEGASWGSGLFAMMKALAMEKGLNQTLLDLHKQATEKEDPHLCNFLETHYLDEQVKAIKKLGDYVAKLTSMDATNNKVAEHLFDKHTLGGRN